MEWVAVIALMCSKPTSDDLKIKDCEKYFQTCVLKLKDHKNNDGTLNKFAIAYELYEDDKLRAFACPQVMK